MYVCVCNAVTDGQIRSAYCDGACSLRAIRERLGVASCCGRCASCARDVLGQCRAEYEASSEPAEPAMLAEAAEDEEPA